jgi:hypothetical protein
MTDEPRLSLPDDVGAYCPDVPDAIALRDLARERARETQYRLTEDEAFAELIAAFWREQLDRWRRGGAVFTLERFPAQSAEELSLVAAPSPDTLARRAVYWTAREYAGFVTQFWYFHSPDVNLRELGTDEERLRWFAALPITQYPAAVRTLLDRLHLSRATVESWVKGGDAGISPTEPKRGKPFWREVHERVLKWLDDEGEPETLAQVENFIHDDLVEHGWNAAESTVRDHAHFCREEHRTRRQGR